jgi:hypothetical protein
MLNSVSKVIYAGYCRLVVAAGFFLKITVYGLGGGFFYITGWN